MAKYNATDDFLEEMTSSHKEELRGNVTLKTIKREEALEMKLKSICERVNGMGEESAREIVDKISAFLDFPEISGRKNSVDGREIRPGQFINALSKAKFRFMMVIENDTAKEVLKCLPLFSYGKAGDSSMRERLMRKDLESGKYFRINLGPSAENSLMAPRHLYLHNEFSFKRAGMTCDGYIEVTLDAVEEIGYDEIKKVVVPSEGCEEFAEKMFNYAMESYSRQERERRGRIISAKERISELESALEEAKKESNHWKQKYEKMRNRCADLYNRDKW
jgi:hypothetical protein